MIVVSQDTITGAWLEGSARLIQGGGDAFTSVLHVRQPAESDDSALGARALLDAVLERHGKYSTQTVANTIFPVELAARHDVVTLSTRYLSRVYPMIRRMKGNQRGTYFQRLIYDAGVTRRREIAERNPLADTLAKMRRQLSGRGPLRAAYELAVYRPSLDANIGRGFPCLSHVSLKLDTARHALHLSAVYRNQDYFERAFGNLLGLARLQAFVARELNLSVGELVCHATHAEWTLGVNESQHLFGAMQSSLRDGAQCAEMNAALTSAVYHEVT